MKKSVFAALVASALISVSAFSASAQEAYPSYVQVNGRADKEIEPNEIYVSITINEKDSKGKVSVEEQERRMLSELQALGIDTKEQLKVSDMSSSLMRRSKAATTKNYQLKLGAAAEVDAVYARLTEAGITDLYISKVTHSDIKKLREQVRVEAMQNARQTAVSLAEAVGQTVGKAFYIFDNNYGESPVVLRASKAMYVNYAGAESMDTAEEESGLEFQKIKLSYSVSAKFVLE